MKCHLNDPKKKNNFKKTQNQPVKTKKSKKYTRTNNILIIVGIQNCLNRIANLFTVIDLRW